MKCFHRKTGMNTRTIGLENLLEKSVPQNKNTSKLNYILNIFIDSGFFFSRTSALYGYMNTMYMCIMINVSRQHSAHQPPMMYTSLSIVNYLT